ncbi:hypothetical protein F4804DRAFT_336964 [Jackrogersella minutella]|nr:hypothetical protein F4804DRAFT_336964 [Jackrogersella minutella]
MSLNPRQTHILQEAETRLPRLLFRGFSSQSGGGIDPRLNSAEGIIPHGFLQGQVPTTIYDIPDLRSMIGGHISGRHISTQFSSWSADLSTAVDFCNRGSIAIIDTNLLDAHVKIYHVEALYDAYLAHTNYDFEYLAYGPITGPAYHCVKYTDIKRAGMSLSRWVSGVSPLFQLPSYAAETSQLVSTVKRVANLFRSPGDRSPDVIISMAVILMHYKCANGYGQEIDVFNFILDHFSNEIRSFRRHSFGISGLVNPKTYTNGMDMPELELIINTLREIDEFIDTRVLPPRLQRRNRRPPSYP